MVTGHANVSITHHHHCCSHHGHVGGLGGGGGCVPSNATPAASNTLAVGHHSHQVVATSGVASNTQIVPDKETVGSNSEDMMSSKGHSAFFRG